MSQTALRQFQLLTADITLGGSDGSGSINVVSRGPFNPVTYPELILLRVIHGGAQWVTNIFDCGHVERTDEQERSRLIDLYGMKNVTDVFPGQQLIPNGDNRYVQAPPPPPKVEPLVPAPATVRAEAGTYGAGAGAVVGSGYVPVDVPAADAEPEQPEATPANPRRPKPVNTPSGN
jgi:hypothetical protein